MTKRLEFGALDRRTIVKAGVVAGLAQFAAPFVWSARAAAAIKVGSRSPRSAPERRRRRSAGRSCQFGTHALKQKTTQTFLSCLWQQRVCYRALWSNFAVGSHFVKKPPSCLGFKQLRKVRVINIALYGFEIPAMSGDCGCDRP